MTEKTKMKQRNLTILFLIFLFAFLAGVHSVYGAETWLVNANKLTLEYRQTLETLAKRCEENNLSEEARKIRLCVPPQADDKIYIPKLPIQVLRSSSDKKSSNSKEGDKFNWEAEFWKTRRNYAEKLFTYAKSAAKRDRGTLAIQMSLAALQADPDHERIRKLLGFVQYKGEWRPPWEAEQLKKGYVDHPRFGWMPAKNVKRYEAGERLYDQKWISKDEDQHFHGQDVRKGWVITSEHYILYTNHSIEEGVRLSRKLEDFYRAWKLLFYRYMASDEELAALFDGKVTPMMGRKHQIYVFRDRKDYTTNLVKDFPQIDQTAGIYTSPRCCLYFDDANKEYVGRVLLHEATHQLFNENRRTTGSYGARWMVEGVATYMETLQSEGDYYVVGGTNDVRFQNAMDDALKKGSYVPLSLLVEAERGQSFSYAQSAGLTHFLMHAENGAFRDAMVQYLRRIYEGKDDSNTLQILTKKSYVTLDEMYLEYLKTKK